MRDFRDAKAMAQTLREALKQKSVSLTHSESLELDAKILGVHDWNELSARIQSDIQSDVQPGRNRAPIRLPTGEDRPAVVLPAGADLPLVPIRDLVMFPYMIVPLFLGREKTMRALDCAMAADKRIVAVAQRQAGDDDPTQEALYGVGVTASVIDLMTLVDGSIRIVVESLERVSSRVLSMETCWRRRSRRSRSRAATARRRSRWCARCWSACAPISTSTTPRRPYSRLPHIREPSVLADMIAPLMPIAIGERQDLLETGNAMARLEKILVLMKNDRRAA